MRTRLWFGRRPIRGVATLAAAASAGFWAATAGADRETTIRFAACGVAPPVDGFALPLDALRVPPGDVPVSVGPVALSPSGAPIHVRFVEVASTAAKRGVLASGVLSLPILGETPREILVTCRHDRVSAAHYRYDDGIAKVPVELRDAPAPERAADG